MNKILHKMRCLFQIALYKNILDVQLYFKKNILTRVVGNILTRSSWIERCCSLLLIMTFHLYETLEIPKFLRPSS